MFTQTSWIIQDIFVVTVHWDLIRYVSMQFLMKCCWIMVETRVTCQFLTLVWPKILAHSCAFLRGFLAFLRGFLAFLRVLARPFLGTFWGFQNLAQESQKMWLYLSHWWFRDYMSIKKGLQAIPFIPSGVYPSPFLQSWCWSCPTFLFFHSIPDPRFLRCWYPTQHGQLESQFTLIWHGSLKKLRHLTKWHLNHLWKSIGKDFWQLHEFTLR